MGDALFAEWQEQVTLLPEKEPQRQENPCIALYGHGTEGKLCKDCVHMRELRYSKTYWKCDLRKNTHGAGTDHKKRWPACARFEAIKP